MTSQTTRGKRRGNVESITFIQQLNNRGTRAVRNLNVHTAA